MVHNSPGMCSNFELLIHALTHSSYANEKKIESNERLELIGDAVISLACLDYLYGKYPTKTEGELTEIKATLVNGKQLAEVGYHFGVDKHIRVGTGESISAKTVGRAVEAVIGAYFLMEGYEQTRFRLEPIFSKIEVGEISQVSYNYKGELQKHFQEVYKCDPFYKLVKSTGPDHDKRFCVQVTLCGYNNIFGYGHGKSVKDAEQDAAKNSLSSILNKSSK